MRTNRVGEADVRHQAFAEERRHTPARAIDELIGDHEIARRMLFPQATDGAEREDPFDAQFLESINVGAEVQLRRADAVAAAVARQEGDGLAFEFADDIIVGRLAEGGFDAHLVLPGKARHRIQTAAADDSDSGVQLRAPLSR